MEEKRFQVSFHDESGNFADADEDSSPPDSQSLSPILEEGISASDLSLEDQPDPIHESPPTFCSLRQDSMKIRISCTFNASKDIKEVKKEVSEKEQNQDMKALVSSPDSDANSKMEPGNEEDILTLERKRTTKTVEIEKDQNGSESQNLDKDKSIDHEKEELKFMRASKTELNHSSEEQNRSFVQEKSPVMEKRAFTSVKPEKEDLDRNMALVEEDDQFVKREASQLIKTEMEDSKESKKSFDSETHLKDHQTLDHDEKNLYTLWGFKGFKKQTDVKKTEERHDDSGKSNHRFEIVPELRTVKQEKLDESDDFPGDKEVAPLIQGFKVAESSRFDRVENDQVVTSTPIGVKTIKNEPSEDTISETVEPVQEKEEDLIEDPLNKSRNEQSDSLACHWEMDEKHKRNSFNDKATTQLDKEADDEPLAEGDLCRLFEQGLIRVKKDENSPEDPEDHTKTTTKEFEPIGEQQTSETNDQLESLNQHDKEAKHDAAITAFYDLSTSTPSETSDFEQFHDVEEDDSDSSLKDDDPLKDLQELEEKQKKMSHERSNDILKSSSGEDLADEPQNASRDFTTKKMDSALDSSFNVVTKTHNGNQEMSEKHAQYSFRNQGSNDQQHQEIPFGRVALEQKRTTERLLVKGAILEHVEKDNFVKDCSKTCECPSLKVSILVGHLEANENLHVQIRHSCCNSKLSIHLKPEKEHNFGDELRHQDQAESILISNELRDKLEHLDELEDQDFTPEDTQLLAKIVRNIIFKDDKQEKNQSGQEEGLEK